MSFGDLINLKRKNAPNIRKSSFKATVRGFVESVCPRVIHWLILGHFRVRFLDLIHIFRIKISMG